MILYYCLTHHYISTHMKNIVPLRSFIFDRLYHPQGGYFCRSDFQVGELSSPIDFQSHIGFDDYQAQLASKYPKNAWLTPSQIFKPYYGMGIANYISQAEAQYNSRGKKSKGIRIVQAGAGTGSAAQSILFYFQNFNQQAFRDLQYHIVEISPNLCKHMQKKLRRSYPKLIQNKQVKIINQNILNYQTDKRCYAIFLQVLDNLPHDKVVYNETSKKYDKMAMVDLNTKQETLADVHSCKLVQECLQLHLKAEKFIKNQSLGPTVGILDRIAVKIAQKFYLNKKHTNQLFLPTALFQLMKDMNQNIPNAHLIMSDFDSLASSISGINAPIVSRKGEKSADKKDYSTYLVDRGEADIFFPVNFQFLKYMHSVVRGRQAQAIKSYEFFEQFSLKEWGMTKSGFNPIKQDFGNTSFVLTKI